MPDASSPPDTKIFLLPAGLAFVIVLFGVIMASVGSYRANRDQESLTWPSTEAVIVGSGRSDYKAPLETYTHQSTVVSYRYEVDGKQYEFRSSQAQGPTLPEKGTTVMLRYDPRDPSDTRFPYQELFPATAFHLVGLAAVLITLPFWYLAKRWYSSARARPAA